MHAVQARGMHAVRPRRQGPWQPHLVAGLGFCPLQQLAAAVGGAGVRLKRPREAAQQAHHAAADKARPRGSVHGACRCGDEARGDAAGQWQHFVGAQPGSDSGSAAPGYSWALAATRAPGAAPAPARMRNRQQQRQRDGCCACSKRLAQARRSRPRAGHPPGLPMRFSLRQYERANVARKSSAALRQGPKLQRTCGARGTEERTRAYTQGRQQACKKAHNR